MKADRREVLQMLGTGLAFSGLAGTAQGAAPAGAGSAAVGRSQPPPLAEVKGRVAYVTGGSSGIGLGLARVLHAAGMKVVMGYIDDKQLADALGFFPQNDPNLYPIRHDVTDTEAWPRVADAIEKRFGNLNLLCSNAGVGVEAAASTGTLKDWQWGLGVNLWGPIHGVHTFVPRMLAHKEPSHIVTTTSMGALIPGSGAGVYAVSKAASLMLMEELRIELAATNIGTSAFIPAGVATNLRNSETYREEKYKNDAESETIRPAGSPKPPSGPLPPGMMDPMQAARIVLDGIRHNDLFIISHPQFRPGVAQRFDAYLESMVTDPPQRVGNPARFMRTPIYAEEVAHRRATRKRKV